MIFANVRGGKVVEILKVVLSRVFRPRASAITTVGAPITQPQRGRIKKKPPRKSREEKF